MNIFKKTLYVLIILFLTNCANYKVEKSKIEVDKRLYFSNGFALIYNDDLYVQGIVNKKLINDEIVAMHSIVKKNTTIKIQSKAGKPVKQKIEKPFKNTRNLQKMRKYIKSLNKDGEQCLFYYLFK